MINLIVLLISFIALVASFFSIEVGWIIISIPNLYLLLTLLMLKQKKWDYVSELSENANIMLKKFGHFYAMPFAGRDYSSSASVLMYAGAIISLVGIFYDFWWGIGIGVLNWFIMGFVSRAFNPTLFLVDYEEEIAHNEIITFLERSNYK